MEGFLRDLDAADVLHPALTFALLLEHGASRERASGEIGPGEWLGHVLEFEIPAP